MSLTHEDKMRDLLNDLEQDRLLRESDGLGSAERRKNLPKRFYKEASVARIEHGDEDLFEVQLDGRPARTPGRAHVRLPAEAAARLVADEYAAQVDVIDPLTMPVARIVNTAIDGVLRDPEPVFEDVLKFVSSDLLCYRADDPEKLVERQRESWDPVLDWAARVAGGRFTLAEGVIFTEQPKETLEGMRSHFRQRPASTDPFRLTCVHLMTSLSGSALLALAVEAKRLSPEEGWKAAHVDEDWQIENWGQDSEAIARRNARWRDFDAAARLIDAL